MSKEKEVKTDEQEELNPGLEADGKGDDEDEQKSLYRQRCLNK